MTTLQQELNQFTGTEAYHHLSIFSCLLTTDGVAYLAKEGKCYWLVDAIASYQPELRKTNSDAWQFQVWKLGVSEDKTAVLTCTDGDENVVITQEIPYTDFPLKSIKLFACPINESQVVLMLPSEY